MKKLILASAVAAMFSTGLACAADHEFSANVGVASEYRYRGMTQSRFEPALQGGVDYTYNPWGVYVGTWASTIKWVKDGGGGNKDVEVDLYAGKTGDIGGGFSYDVGGLYYWYPDNNLSDSANTFEVYGQLGYGPFYAKYSYALTELFGWKDSEGSQYIDLGASFDIGNGYALNAHYGVNLIETGPGDTTDLDYNDYKLGVSKAFYGVDFDLSVIGTQGAVKSNYQSDNAFSGKTRVVLTASKSF